MGSGEVSEWPKEPISKIGRCSDVPRGFESHPLRQMQPTRRRRGAQSAQMPARPQRAHAGEVLEWPIRHAWKACRGASPSWVRIPPSPPPPRKRAPSYPRKRAPSYPRLPRVSRRAEHQAPSPPPHPHARQPHTTQPHPPTRHGLPRPTNPDHAKPLRPDRAQPQTRRQPPDPGLMLQLTTAYQDLPTLTTPNPSDQIERSPKPAASPRTPAPTYHDLPRPTNPDHAKPLRPDRAQPQARRQPPDPGPDLPRPTKTYQP